MVQIKPNYSFSKTLAKFGWSFAEVFIASLIVYFTDNEYAIFLIPVFEAVRNWIKNRNLGK